MQSKLSKFIMEEIDFLCVDEFVLCFVVAGLYAPKIVSLVSKHISRTCLD